MKLTGRIDTNPVIRTLVLVALLSTVAGLSTAQDTPDVRLMDQKFDWTDAREDTAHFEWSVNVVNETNRAYQVRVILELLDDDDRVINRDDSGAPSDMVTITVEANSRQSVQASGRIPYDMAAEVVSLRHRRELVDSSQR
jgi:hypothetical protein